MSRSTFSKRGLLALSLFISVLAFVAVPGAESKAQTSGGNADGTNSSGSKSDASLSICKHYGKQCPKEMPYCVQGNCTATVADRSIEDGCQPGGSYPGACVGNEDFHCRKFREEFDDPDAVPARTAYRGNPDDQPFFSDFGDNAVVEDGKLVLKMRYADVRKAGHIAKITSTRWVRYGRYTARVKTSNVKGMIFTWIFKTSTDRDDVGDEIDYEWVPASDATETQTNYFINGVIDYTRGKPFFMAGGNTTTDQFHDYTINYEPNKIEWLIDGQVMRTINNVPGEPFPSQEGRLFASIWDSCGEPEGTVTWANGPSEWCGKQATDASKKKEYRMWIDWIDVECYPGYGNNTVAEKKPKALKDAEKKKFEEERNERERRDQAKKVKEAKETSNDGQNGDKRETGASRDIKDADNQASKVTAVNSAGSMHHISSAMLVFVAAWALILS